MDYENPAVKHAEALKQMNDEFSVSEIVFKQAGIVFDTNHLNHWSVKKEDEAIYIEPYGFVGFSVKRKTNLMNDTVSFLMNTNDYSKKYRNGDLYSLIQESFGLFPVTDKSDISEDDTERFFYLYVKLLRYLNHSTDMLLNINPKTMHAITLADLMNSTAGELLLKSKDNQQAVIDLVNVTQKYREIDKSDQFNVEKFYILLNGLEEFSNKYIS